MYNEYCDDIAVEKYGDGLKIEDITPTQLKSFVDQLTNADRAQADRRSIVAMRLYCKLQHANHVPCDIFELATPAEYVEDKRQEALMVKGLQAAGVGKGNGAVNFKPGQHLVPSSAAHDRLAVATGIKYATNTRYICLPCSLIIVVDRRLQLHPLGIRSDSWISNHIGDAHDTAVTSYLAQHFGGRTPAKLGWKVDDDEVLALPVSKRWTIDDETKLMTMREARLDRMRATDAYAAHIKEETKKVTAKQTPSAAATTKEDKEEKEDEMKDEQK